MSLLRSRSRRQIDWEEIRQRLARATAALEGGLQLTPEQARAVLEQRSRSLAHVPDRAPQAAEVLEVVTFALADERYALQTRYINQVVRLTEVTPIPGTPEVLVGIINLRGEILAVFDLRPLFHLAGRGRTDRTRLIVLGETRAEFGILADAVLEVTSLRIDELLEPSDWVTGIGRPYLRSVTSNALIVLDGPVLLQDDHFVINQDENLGG